MSNHSYFNNLLSFYTRFQDNQPQAMASFVSFSNTKDGSKEKTEHVLTNNCVQLTKDIWIGDFRASSHM